VADNQGSQDTVTFKLNGNSVTVPKGWTVMQAARREKVDIPHFCWHPGLTVAGVCRFCMVKVNGRPKLEIACNLQATDGMDVNTTEKDVETAHKWALEFHLINHPLDCPICDQAGECSLQDNYMKVGKYHSQMMRPKVLKPKALHVGGDLVLDTERCILCSRCTRFEKEVTKTGALGIFDRGDRSVIGIYPDKKINHNYTANLVDICPVGAFTSENFRFKQRVWFLKDRPATCPGCSTGCQTKVYAKEETRRFFRLKPADSVDSGNWMCDKGRGMYEHLNKESRMLFAYQTGTAGSYQRVGNDDALKDLGAKIKAAGKDQVAILISAQYTNEEYAALFSLLVDKFGIKKVFQWREPTEKVADFDGLLYRGDHNSNTAGLLAALKSRGLGDSAKNQFDDVAQCGAKIVLAFAPEIPKTFPSFKDQLKKLSELGSVAVFSCTYEPKDFSFSTLIPLRGFAEKSGTVTNFEGKQQVSADSFPAVVAEALCLKSVANKLGAYL